MRSKCNSHTAERPVINKKVASSSAARIRLVCACVVGQFNQMFRLAFVRRYSLSPSLRECGRLFRTERLDKRERERERERVCEIKCLKKLIQEWLGDVVRLCEIRTRFAQETNQSSDHKQPKTANRRKRQTRCVKVTTRSHTGSCCIGCKSTGARRNLT